jgi:hypothetical protein
MTHNYMRIYEYISEGKPVSSRAVAAAVRS